MKKKILALLLVVGLAGLLYAQNTTVYHEQGGSKLVVASGGEIEVQSGGTLDVQSGATTLYSGLTASRLVVTDGSKGLASNGAITTNAIPKSASSGASLSASSISDDGSTVTLTATDLAVGGGDIDAGASGAAGTVDIFPSTGSMGKLSIAAADSAGDTTTTITNASQSGARTYTIPDAGASTTFALVTNAGTAGAGATTTELIDGFHRTTLTLAVSGGQLVTLADGDHGGGRALYTFPEGYIYIVGGVLNASAVTNTANFNASTNDTFSFAIGTATAADDNDLTSTEANVIAKQTVDTDSGGTLTRALTNTGITTPIYVDGTAAAVGLFANFAVADAMNTDANDFGVVGTLTVVWAYLGDK